MLLFERIINKLGHPFGLNVFPRSFSPMSGSSDRSSAFAEIYRTGYWRVGETRSGCGSEHEFAKSYGLRLARLLRRRNFQSLFDAPCGDLNWMSDLLARQALDYIGGDIAANVVEEASASYPHLKIGVFDICEDAFPTVDVWHCRDCFFHLPFADIRLALSGFLSSGVPWALLTTHHALIHENLDVAAGGFRLLDLESPPISLPPADEYVQDFRRGRDFPRYVGLWSREAVAKAFGGNLVEARDCQIGRRRVPR